MGSAGKKTEPHKNFYMETKIDRSNMFEEVNLEDENSASLFEK